MPGIDKNSADASTAYRWSVKSVKKSITLSAQTTPTTTVMMRVVPGQ